MSQGLEEEVAAAERIVQVNIELDNQSLNGTLEIRHYSHRSPWLRAGVLGANDGLVSLSALLVGIVTAQKSTNEDTAVLSGLSALVAGALSMALGEYVSVASQKDSELADLKLERKAHEGIPHVELEELTRIYMERGLPRDLAKQVAVELSKKDPVAAHARDELGIDIDNLTSPFQAAYTSVIAFVLGGIVPLLVVVFAKKFALRMALLVSLTVVMLSVFGGVGSYLGGAPIWKGSLRVAFGGSLAMAGTYLAGYIFGSVSA
jgi:VIT1/CCC1 family predicted Fe2+/Mn2+ transporter